MSELTKSLKTLVTRYPGTMAELARSASIDRSTLYKILGGQRTPRQEQLLRLADALELSGEQKAALLLQYKQRSRATDPKIRTELHKMLETAFRVDDYARPSGAVPNETAAALPCPDSFVEGTRAVTACAAALVANYLLSGDTRPILLSPFSNQILDRVLIDRFAMAEGAPVPVCQLLLFTPSSDIPREAVGNIGALTRALPFLFLPKMNYEAHVVRSAMTEPVPGTLLPVYLLLPDKALFMDFAGQKAMVMTDRKAVENLRLSFSRQYVDASAMLALATNTHDFAASMELYSRLLATRPKSSMIRYQPPFSLFADPGIAARVVRQDAGMGSVLPTMVDYLDRWTQLTPDLYFCEEGLLEFVRSGTMYDLPPQLYTPPDTATRRELLLRLRRAASLDRQTLRIVDPASLALTPTMSVNIFRGVGVVFCQAMLESDQMYCREYLMADTRLTDGLLGYLDDIRATGRVRSQKYTLDFIDYCLRLL